MNTYKVVALSALSAVIGATVAVGVLRYKPHLLTSAGSKTAAENSEQYSEKDFIEKLKRDHLSMQKQFDDFFDDQFFDREDPFESLRKFREQMDEQMKDFGPPNSMDSFDSWFGHKFGGGTVEDIQQREDDDYVYYDVAIGDLQSTSLNAKVEGGYVTITGKTERKSEGGEQDNEMGQSVFSSTFKRTFPVPAEVDESKMEMLPGENKITLRFPKQKA